MRPFIFFICVAFILSCSEKKEQQEKDSVVAPAAPTAAKKISIAKIGDIEFIRSFSFLMNSTLSKREKDKLFDETQNSNPVFSKNYPYLHLAEDSAIKHRFEQLGIVEGDELLMDRLKFKTNPRFFLEDNSSNKIAVRLDAVPDVGYYFKISNGLDSASLRIDEQFIWVKYLLIDFIPGGYKEVVLFYEHYLANTEFYELLVYQIRS